MSKTKGDKMYIYEQEEQDRRTGESHAGYWQRKKDEASEYCNLTPQQAYYYEKRRDAGAAQDRLESAAKPRAEIVILDKGDGGAFSDARIAKFADKLSAAADICRGWLDNEDGRLSRRDFLKENLCWITECRKMLLRAMEVTE